MKKLLFILLVIATGAGFVYFEQQGMIPGLNNDTGLLRAHNRQFWEYIQFKEFARAAAFHEKGDDSAHADIAKLIEKTFKVPPESLDIQEITVLMVEIDSTKTLGRSKTLCKIKDLARNEYRNQEVMLFWFKEDGKWKLRLESTLKRFS